MVFQRLCREGANLFLRKGTRRGLFPLMAESEGRIAIAMTEAERLAWNLEPGGHLNAFFLDRGRRFEATFTLVEPGSLDGVECYFFEQPRQLVGLDDRRFTDFVPHSPIPCVFSTSNHDVCEGRIRALGAEGIELRPEGVAISQSDLLRVDGVSTVELSIGAETRLRLEGTVAYFREGLVGIIFREEGAEATLRTYRSWLMDSLLSQLQRDREAFNPGGARTVRNLGPRGEKPGTRARLIEDRDPLVLVIAEGEALPQRLADALGRVFGFAALDYLQGPVQPLAAAVAGEAEGWGRFRMILVHHRLRLLSGMELLRKLVEEEGCPLPILVAGTEEDLELKRERARSLGALDYVPVQPFRILTLKLALEEALRLPGSQLGTSVPGRPGR
jgi:CheY-like chemotaxis protein